MKPEILHEEKTDDPEKKLLKIVFFIFENIFLFFPIFTKEIQAKINELESENNIFA